MSFLSCRFDPVESLGESGQVALLSTAEPTRVPMVGLSDSARAAMGTSRMRAGERLRRCILSRS